MILKQRKIDLLFRYFLMLAVGISLNKAETTERFICKVEDEKVANKTRNQLMELLELDPEKGEKITEVRSEDRYNLFIPSELVEEKLTKDIKRIEDKLYKLLDKYRTDFTMPIDNLQQIIKFGENFKVFLFHLKPDSKLLDELQALNFCVSINLTDTTLIFNLGKVLKLAKTLADEERNLTLLTGVYGKKERGTALANLSNQSHFDRNVLKLLLSFSSSNIILQENNDPVIDLKIPENEADEKTESDNQSRQCSEQQAIKTNSFSVPSSPIVVYPGVNNVVVTESKVNSNTIALTIVEYFDNATQAWLTATRLISKFKLLDRSDSQSRIGTVASWKEALQSTRHGVHSILLNHSQYDGTQTTFRQVSLPSYKDLDSFFAVPSTSFVAEQKHDLTYEIVPEAASVFSDTARVDDGRSSLFEAFQQTLGRLSMVRALPAPNQTSIRDVPLCISGLTSNSTRWSECYHNEDVDHAQNIRFKI